MPSLRPPSLLARPAVVALCAAALAGTAAAAASRPPSAAAPSEADPGFLVLAPDRGFLGNEELRDAYNSFAAGRKAELVFVTDERTGQNVDAALRSLDVAGAGRVVVLPFFLSRSDPRYVRAASLLEDDARQERLAWARPFGESYFAVEALAGHLRAVPERASQRLIVVGSAGRDTAAEAAVRADSRRLAEAAAAGLGFESVRVVVETTSEGLGQALGEAVAGAPRAAFVPFHLGSKLDGMMSYTALVRSAAPEGVTVAPAEVTPDAAVVQWMAREANRWTPLAAGDIGVVVLAHGADYHWNETMRRAVSPLAERYKVEPAFSMADPVVLGRAVGRLEDRGARLIVILRVFGLASSFRSDVERLIGLDVERGAAPNPHAGHDMGHGHPPPPPAPRLRSSAVLVTAGGVEDHPLFAEALLERAQALSRDPERETVVLVAHGAAADEDDEHWKSLLDSLAARMREKGGHRFRAIRSGTWREDWPDKRTAAVAEVRTLVQDASTGGRALVIPARTLGQGPERRLLAGLSFELGEGFAPHPLFARWAEQTVAQAVAEHGTRD